LRPENVSGKDIFLLSQGSFKALFCIICNIHPYDGFPFQTHQYLQEIKKFVAAESKGSTQLDDALQKALEAQSTFQKLEQEVREKFQEELERVSVLQSSNSTLNKSLCEARETVRSVQNLNLLSYHMMGLKASKMFWLF
jgi:hypothetical protein